MRPVDRGSAPRIYHRYGEAIGDLEERLGNYCSYCERRLPISLAVEHMVPKSVGPALETEWSNFLLGCTNCNSIKGNQSIEIDDFLWPDRDNTALAIAYRSGGFIKVASNLNQEQQMKAQKLLNLVGLQRHPASGEDKPAPRDKRWQQREEVWTAAQRSLEIFETLDQRPEAMEQVLIAAKGFGFFSIWMTIFSDYPEIKRRLIDLFPSTSCSCFDANGKPVNRPGGII